jgi:hypothetical protein
MDISPQFIGDLKKESAELRDGNCMNTNSQPDHIVSVEMLVKMLVEKEA